MENSISETSVLADMVVTAAEAAPIDQVVTAVEAAPAAPIDQAVAAVEAAPASLTEIIPTMVLEAMMPKPVFIPTPVVFATMEDVDARIVEALVSFKTAIDELQAHLASVDQTTKATLSLRKPSGFEAPFKTQKTTDGYCVADANGKIVPSPNGLMFTDSLDDVNLYVDHLNS